MGRFTGRIRLAEPDDAPAVTALVRACYGDTYCVPTGVDARHVAEAIRSGREIYALACTLDGRLVAQAALIEANPGLFECARVVVDVDHRQQGLMRRLTCLLFQQAAPLRAQLLTAAAVTSHAFGQRNAQVLDMVPLGVLLAQYPAWMRVAGFPPREEATSSVLFARGTSRLNRLRELGLRGEDAAFAEQVLAKLGLDTTRSTTPTSTPLRWALRSDARLGLTHLRLGTLGDAAPPWAALELTPQRVQWADVPAEHPAAARWCEDLRSRGFGLAAYLPLSGPQGQDVLRLQRLSGDEQAVDGLRLLPHLRALQDRVLRECVPVEALA